MLKELTGVELFLGGEGVVAMESGCRKSWNVDFCLQWVGGGGIVDESDGGHSG